MPDPLSAETIKVLSSNFVMPNDEYPRARRCIAKTKSGCQCKNSVNCSYHRCNESDCEEEPSHSRRDTPLTPSNLRHDYYLSGKKTRLPQSIPDPISRQSTKTETVISEDTSSNDNIGNENGSVQATSPGTTRLPVVSSTDTSGSENGALPRRRYRTSARSCTTDISKSPDVIGKRDTIAVSPSLCRTQSVPIPYIARPESHSDHFGGVSNPILTHLSQRQRLNAIQIMVESIGNVWNEAVDTPKKVDDPKSTHLSQRQRLNTVRIMVESIDNVWNEAVNTPKKVNAKNEKAKILHQNKTHRRNEKTRRPSDSEVRTPYSVASQPFPGPDDATVPEPEVQYQDSPAMNVGTSVNYEMSGALLDWDLETGQEIPWTNEGQINPTFLASSLSDGALADPTIFSTLPDPTLEAGVATKGKERERRYSNRRDHTECPPSTPVALKIENAETREIDANMAVTNAMSDRLEAEYKAKNAERENAERENTERGNTERENTERENAERENAERENAEKVEAWNAKAVDTAAETEAIKKETDKLRRQRRQSYAPQTPLPPSTLNQVIMNAGHGINISQMRELGPHMIEVARQENSRLERRVSIVPEAEART